IFCDWQRREGVRPTGVEGEMRDDLRGLSLRQALIHRLVEVRGELRDLAGRDECADGDQTPIPRREVRTKPQVAKKDVGGVLHDSRKRRAELLADARCAVRLGRFVERERWR